MNIDWSKAPEGVMGYHPHCAGYVDHWLKWESNGDNWFSVVGFESGGWVKALVPLEPENLEYLIRRPEAIDAREKEIRKMLEVCGTTAVIVQLACEQLFDAGYRKFEIVEGDA